MSGLSGERILLSGLHCCDEGLEPGFDVSENEPGYCDAAEATVLDRDLTPMLLEPSLSPDRLPVYSFFMSARACRDGSTIGRERSLYSRASLPIAAIVVVRTQILFPNF